MKQNANSSALLEQPLIVKYVQPYPSGIQSQRLARHAIGYVVRGRKRIYMGDSCREVRAGDLFYLNIGAHYVENIPDSTNSFEQITCFFSPSQLNGIVSTLNSGMDLNIDPSHKCEYCREKEFVIYPAWSTIKSFFACVNQYIRSNQFSLDRMAEQIKITELIYLIISNPECCIRSRILGGIDLKTQSFEQGIREHIFDNMSIEDMAKSFNKSMTSFKKEFHAVFGQPPHRWLIAQRLSMAKLLLVSTSKSVSEIGDECSFPNTSHFIKLFKKEYATTPAAYRAQNGRRDITENQEQSLIEAAESEYGSPRRGVQYARESVSNDNNSAF